ncbi:MAG: response regulator [Desulfurivibrio sp.]|nr:response regulator [Desulfurivibrio sp.]
MRTASGRLLPPSVIILDLGLPGISGREVMERLKKNPETRHIPVHFVSASDRSSELMQLGAVGFLTKPVSAEKLGEVFYSIEKLVESPVKRLLIIEDDLVQRQAIRALIGDSGDVEVIEAASGEHALELLAGEHFDCVILDLGLGGMSGFDLLARIKDDPQIAKTPVVIYTGREISPDEEERLQQYADSIIIKGPLRRSGCSMKPPFFSTGWKRACPTSSRKLSKPCMSGNRFSRKDGAAGG